jgi:N-acetylglucosamine kinase-like BadF-type ATPase
VRGLVLGVDGGNTKTIALVARADGEILGAGRAGASDIYGAPSPEAAVGEVRAAAASALAAAGAAPDEIEAAAFSLAGADWPEDFEYLRRELAGLMPEAPAPLVVNDAIGAVRAGIPGGIGVAIVCGTGGCIGARGADGRYWHSSWWALHTGAWEMGQRALEAIYRAELGLARPTALTPRALEVFGEADVEALLHSFTRHDGRGEFEAGELAPALLDEAVAGDEVAREIVEHQAGELADFARVGAKKVGLDAGFPLVLLGGVFRHPSRLLGDAILARLPEGKPVASSFEPAVGALLLAIDAIGASADPELLRASLPASDLFVTS